MATARMHPGQPTDSLYAGGGTRRSVVGDPAGNDIRENDFPIRSAAGFHVNGVVPGARP